MTPITVEQDEKPDRGITVGKSWPRPATPCDLVPRWEGEFCSHGDWVNFASKRLTVAYDSNGSQLKAVCVDSFGRRCANGRDFQRAHDEGAFPVRYFWDCEPARTQSEGVREALEALRKHVINHACVWDDAANGSHHHPIWQQVASALEANK